MTDHRYTASAVCIAVLALWAFMQPPTDPYWSIGMLILGLGATVLGCIIWLIVALTKK